MSSSEKSWRSVRVTTNTSDTLPAPNYRELVDEWIDAASQQHINAEQVGCLPATRTVDYASSNGEYVALIRVGEELLILSLSHFNAAACNVPTRILEARTIEPIDNLLLMFSYAGAS